MRIVLTALCIAGSAAAAAADEIQVPQDYPTI